MLQTEPQNCNMFPFVSNTSPTLPRRQVRQPSWVEEMYAELTVCPGLPAEDVEVKMGDKSDMETGWEQRPLFAKSVADIFSVDECEVIKRAALAVGLTREPRCGAKLAKLSKCA